MTNLTAGFQRYDLGPGIEAYLLPTTKFKVVTIKVYLHQPLDEHATERALLVQVMKRGCRGYPTQRRILEFLEDLYGAAFVAAVLKVGERQVLYVRIETVSDAFLPRKGSIPRAVEFLKRVIYHPHRVAGTLSAEYVRTEGVNLKNMILGLVNERAEYAVERAIEEMCRGEPYGNYEYGKAEEADRIEPAALAARHEEVIRTSPITILASGSFDADKLARRLEREFSRRRPEVRSLPSPVRVARNGEPRFVSEQMAVEQGNLVLGMRTGTTMADPDYYALLVLNALYGAFPHSRLFANVREREGLAYSIFSSVESTKGLMLVHAGIDFAARERAQAMILAELDAIRQGNVDEKEVREVQIPLCDRIRKWEDDPGARMGALAEMLVNGVALTGDEVIERIRAVTPADVSRVAAKVVPDTVYFLTK